MELTPSKSFTYHEYALNSLTLMYLIHPSKISQNHYLFRFNPGRYPNICPHAHVTLCYTHSSARYRQAVITALKFVPSARGHAYHIFQIQNLSMKFVTTT